MTAILALQVALVNFALGFAPDRLDFVDQTLVSVVETLVKNNVTTLEGKAGDDLCFLFCFNFMVLLVPYLTVANVTRLEGHVLLYPSNCRLF